MLQEDDADEDDDADTPHSTMGGPPNGPLQHHRSGRSASTDSPDGALGISPLRPTTSNAAGGRKSDAEHRSMQRSARMKVHSPLQVHCMVTSCAAMKVAVSGAERESGPGLRMASAMLA